MLNVRDKKKKEKEMNNNICQNKKLNAYLYKYYNGQHSWNGACQIQGTMCLKYQETKLFTSRLIAVIKIIIRKRKTWHIDQVANSVDTVKSIHGSI